MKQEKATPSLIALLDRGDSSERARARAAEALGVIGASEATHSLMAALSDASPEVRYWSAYALGVLQATSARPILQQLAESDPGVVEGGLRVADEARWALAQMQS